MEDGFIKKIDWNYEDLKAEIETRTAEYAASVYNDDSIKNAKDDRAKLNKLKDALEGKRSSVRKQMLEPYEIFSSEIKSLTVLIDKAISNIDGQVKDYESRQRKMKEAKIREFYDANIFDLEKYLPFERVIKPSYLNVSTSMKSIKEEISAMIQRVSEGIALLNDTDSPYVVDMKAEFLKTYDIGAALAEKLIQAGKKEEAAPEQKPAPQEAPKTAVEQKTVPEEEPVCALDFRVYVTKSQMEKLKKFLNDSGIRFEPVPRQ